MSVVEELPLQQEYAKKTGISEEDIAKLRAWLAAQPHLPSEHISDLDLILTFHCCGRSAQRAKQLLDLHYTLRTLFTHLFKDRQVDDAILSAMDCVLWLPLETRSHDGCKVIYGRLVDYEPKKFNFSDDCRLAFMVMDLWQRAEGSWPGLVLLVDMQGVALAHLTRLDYHTLQEFFYYLQEAMLVNLKGIHFLNAPSFMDKVLFIIRPFMKKHLLDMMGIHQPGSRTLEKYLPMEALPSDCGGKYMAVDDAKAMMRAKLLANRDYFSQENLKRVTEARRPGRPTTIADIFGGVEGSFKKLEID
ncbi:hypothetical protein JYU34_012321 [Plutella xylostella]|uniref:CRAL-TRIO domain-containing protein n=1 Tax=Plutella xylostella TaxID=51655 RepID=A0ABQ7QEV9_PLUXY|nr:hypothetical protein JYU34_012321 [Plutella xylostella]